MKRVPETFKDLWDAKTDHLRACWLARVGGNQAFASCKWDQLPEDIRWVFHVNEGWLFPQNATAPPLPQPGDRVLAQVPNVGLRWGWCMFSRPGNSLVALNLGFGRIVWVGLGDVAEVEAG